MNLQNHQSIGKKCLKTLNPVGLEQCDLIVNDNLSGINSVIKLQYEGIKIQQCVLHLKRNVFKKIMMKHRKEVAKDLAIVFDMIKSDDTQELAFKRAKVFSEKWSIFILIYKNSV